MPTKKKSKTAKKTAPKRKPAPTKKAKAAKSPTKKKGRFILLKISPTVTPAQIDTAKVAFYASISGPGGTMAAVRYAVSDAAGKIEPITVDVLFDLLGLVMVEPPRIHAIDTWTLEMREAARMWAAACHLDASDNEGIVVPKRPAFLDEYLTPYEKGVEAVGEGDTSIMDGLPEPSTPAEDDDDGDPIADLKAIAAHEPSEDTADA